MLVGKMIKVAMAEKGIKNLVELAKLTQLTGIGYQSVYRAANDNNNSLITVAGIFASMGYELQAVPVKGGSDE